MPRECTESNSFRGKTLEFCSWNIHGLQSRQLGSKFLDPEFLNIIKNVDFLGLTETHIHGEILEDLNIPGFIRISYKNRKKIFEIRDFIRGDCSICESAHCKHV